MIRLGTTLMLLPWVAAIGLVATNAPAWTALPCGVAMVAGMLVVGLGLIR